MMRSFVQMLCRVYVLTIMAWAVALPVVAQRLENPLRFSSIETFIEGVVRAVVMIALPIITIFVVYAGFMFIKARGKPDKLTEARNNFVYVFIGAALILGAWVLATLIGSTVTQLLRG